jgi:hypothetical protein
MGEFIITAADTFGLASPHIVGPDIGTAAALFAAAAHPGQLRSLVVGSGGAAVPLQLGSRLNDWVQAPDLDRFRRADPRQIVAGALSGIERYSLPDAVRKDYLRAYEGDRMAESMRYVRAYPAELPALRDLLPATAPAGTPSGPASRPSVIASGMASPSGVRASTRAGWPPCVRCPLLMAARKQAPWRARSASGMISRPSACPTACSAPIPVSRSAARFQDVTYPWLSVVTIASPAAATAADASAGSTVGRPSAVDIGISLTRQKSAPRVISSR